MVGFIEINLSLGSLKSFDVSFILANQKVFMTNTAFEMIIFNCILKICKKINKNSFTDVSNSGDFEGIAIISCCKSVLTGC